MLMICEGSDDPLSNPVLRPMFEARRRVFVDLMGWQLPVVGHRFEVDQFDGPDAVYLVLSDSAGGHVASARLLKTTGPHILGSLFPQLCAAGVPSGPGILEITRFCLDPRQRASERLEARNRLVTALVDHALRSGIEAYTGVAEIGWLQQVLAFGWACRPLGLPQPVGGTLVGALRIDIDEETPRLLAANGIHREAELASIAQAA
ncbi:MAG: GNAT family N-acetyltransferase [Alphaproteobacteria bacterium]|nr:MAG: GNAT family N-acetyltransferase [Alphaproteobacteria bacterium]